MKGKKHPENIRRQALRLRRSGLTYEDIAAALGIPPSTVWNWCRLAGLTRRTMTAYDSRECLRLWRCGWTVARLSREFERTHTTIYRILRNAELLEASGKPYPLILGRKERA